MSPAPPFQAPRSAPPKPAAFVVLPATPGQDDVWLVCASAGCPWLIQVGPDDADARAALTAAAGHSHERKRP